MAATGEQLHAYFSTALTGVDEQLRQTIDDTVSVVREACGRAEVELYFPGDHTDPVRDAHVPAADVYRIDRERVKSADVMFAFVGAPSFGVGQELTMAYESLIPTVLLVPSGARVSRMVLGVPLELEQLVYGDLAELRDTIDPVLARLLKRARARRASGAELERHDVGNAIRRQREKVGLSHADLGAAVGLTPEGLADLESSTDRQADVSLTQLRLIAAALGVSASSLM